MSNPYMPSVLNVLTAEKAQLVRQVETLRTRVRTLEALNGRLQDRHSAPCPVCHATFAERMDARSGNGSSGD